MIKRNLNIKNIPSILWGKGDSKLFIAVHGNMSNKADDVIVILAEEAVKKGYQVLSFDLPEHGDRKGEKDYKCNVKNCIHDLNTIMDYAKLLSNDISLFACSIGAYFSLLSYKDESLRQSLFLSPVVDMKRIIENMMKYFNVSENRLKNEKEVKTPIGQTLYWDYYCFVKKNPIIFWNNKTSILYGSKDDVCEHDTISSFAERFNCSLKIMNGGEHYFHTKEQLQFFRKWVESKIE